MIVICHKTCTTCKKAKQWLADNGFTYEERDVKTQNPSREELQIWYEKAGLPIKSWFNTSGNLYKEYNLKEKLPNMTVEEQLDLLATDGMLVKRPILLEGDTVLVGFKEKEWDILK
ncbi:MAG: arsenate reductase family protein [Oscillospiraceae bacterium]|nr:arsenate reductase family protein [Oscillospiraceae bacterium]